MTTLLQHSDTHVLLAEKIRGKWWLETIERDTGLTWVINCDTKDHAESFFKGMSFTEIMDFLTRMKVEPDQVYKSGLSWSHLD